MIILSKNTTCGVLYRYGDKFLICHATLTPWWSIPKGLRNSGESLTESAVRELKEETSIILKPSDLSLKGVFPYRENKDLALFEYIATKPLDTELLVCTSFFKHTPTGEHFPEVDKFRMVTIDEAKRLLNRNLYRIIKKFMRLSGND
mgnify:FL=1